MESKAGTRARGNVPLSNAERTRRSRARQQTNDLTAAVAVASLVRTGRAGDGARALAEWLDRIADKAPGGESDDRVEAIRAAAERLRLRRGA
jgi:hypothetical protein